MALTDKQIKQEEEFLKGVPRFNLAAFLLPPLWGPVYGFWITILYYPAWIFMDNLLYGVYVDPSPLTIIFALVVCATYVGFSVAFSLVSQPLAYHRAHAKGVSKEKYLKQQRIWAIAAVIITVIMLALSTYYNLAVRIEL
ncbi:MAG: viscotoxin-A3 [Eggerthellaceae bacterium]|nr:viscotoxin-A3 [Eggerthellaceae bacterium]